MSYIKQSSPHAERVIREAECRQLTGICRTTRYMMEKEGQFPARRKLVAALLVGFFLKFLSGSGAAAKQLKGEVWAQNKGGHAGPPV